MLKWERIRQENKNETSSGKCQKMYFQDNISVCRFRFNFLLDLYNSSLNHWVSVSELYI